MVVYQRGTQRLRKSKLYYSSRKYDKTFTEPAPVRLSWPRLLVEAEARRGGPEYRVVPCGSCDTYIVCSGRVGAAAGALPGPAASGAGASLCAQATCTWRAACPVRHLTASDSMTACGASLASQMYCCWQLDQNGSRLLLAVRETPCKWAPVTDLLACKRDNEHARSTLTSAD